MNSYDAECITNSKILLLANVIYVFFSVFVNKMSTKPDTECVFNSRIFCDCTRIFS